MDALLVASIPILPSSPIKMHRLISTDSNYSSLSSVPEEYSTPHLSIRRSRTSSDLDTTSSDHSLSDGSDYEDCVSSIVLAKHVHFASSPKPKIHIQVSLVNDEAEFFAVVVPDDSLDTSNKEESQTPKAVRKRDKIRTLFNKKFQQPHSDASESSGGDWNEALARTLASMHRDIEEIITGFDEVDRPCANTASENLPERILSVPRLSFAQRQRGKLQLMRMAQMLYPPNLLTCDAKESPYPYTDIVAPQHFNLLRIKKNLPFESLLTQHRPFRHKKFRYRTQRCLLRMRRDLKKLKQDIYGAETLKSHKELPSLDVQNYRNRLEKTLSEVRTQIAEYDRAHCLAKDHRPSISQIITKLNGLDSNAQAQIQDYRTKLRPVEYIEKRSNRDLISAPFIPRRPRYRSTNALTSTNSNTLIDTRFDPGTFVDLNKEAESFFDDDKPFWTRSTDSRSSISSVSSSRRLSNHVILPAKTGLWNRFIYAFKVKQQMLKIAELTETENEHDDVFLPYTSLSVSQKEVQTCTVLNVDQNKEL